MLELEQFLQLPTEEQIQRIKSLDLASLTDQQAEALRLWAAPAIASEFTPRGFKEYFYCIYGKELPLHAYYGFIIPIWWAHGGLTRRQLDEEYEKPEARKFRFIYDKIKDAGKKRGIIIRASREMAKTIVITQGIRGFFIGHHPEKMTLLVQLADESAKDNGTKVAEIIEQHPMWKAIFPRVRPDKGGEVDGEKKTRRWGAQGYFVIDESKSLEDWSKSTADRVAPTIQSVGVNTSIIIGKHPDGIVIIDDIHDESNTSSDRELKSVLAKVRSNFIYAPTEQAWMVFVGTPWVEGDALDEFAKTGEFLVVDIAAYMEFDEKGEPVLPTEPYNEDGNYLYLWPEQRGKKWVISKWRISPASEFARMVQLNVSKSLLRQYNYQTFPAKDIRWQEWPIIFGVDPVATVEMNGQREGGISHFACAFALKTPYNTIVIGDGIYEKCGATKAVELIGQNARQFRMFQRASIEGDGAGMLFAADVRAMGVNVHRYKTAEIKKTFSAGSHKAQRQYDILERLLSRGLLTISDANTPFLVAARRYLDKYPNLDKTAGEWDVADSILLAVVDIPEIWKMVTAISYGTDDIQRVFKKREMAKHPMATAGGIRV